MLGKLWTIPAIGVLLPDWSKMSRLSLKGFGISGRSILLIGYGALEKELVAEISKHGGLVVGILEDRQEC